MEELTRLLDSYRKKLSEEHKITDDMLSRLHSVYPFNRFEYVISHLLADNLLSLDDYISIREDYISRNKYLHLFEMAPRTFGETWGQQHISELVQELERPSKKLDPTYNGEYDFWYKGIKIEVKGSRGVNKDLKELPPIEKALSYNSPHRFNMNFQQLKPRCCDVFVWFAVWKDRIIYWVFKNDEVEHSAYFSHGQHRGNVGEGQLWITEKNIHDFDEWLVTPSQILSKIVEKYKLPPYEERVNKDITEIFKYIRK